MVAHNRSMIHFLKDTATVAAMFATGVIIDEKAVIPIGTLLTVCALVWWLGRKLQKIDDRLDSIEGSVDGLECVRHKICPREDDKPSEKLRMR